MTASVVTRLAHTCSGRTATGWAKALSGMRIKAACSGATSRRAPVMAADPKGGVTDRWTFRRKSRVLRPLQERTPGGRRGARRCICSIRRMARCKLLVRAEPTSRRSIASTTARSGRTAPTGSAPWTTGRCGKPQGTLYRITADGKAEKKVTGMTVPNGIAWGPGGTVFYHSDPRGRWIDAYDFVPATGAWSNRRRIVADLTEEAGPPRWRRLRCRGLLLERRRLRGRAQPIQPGRQAAGNDQAAVSSSDHAVLRRRRYEDAVRHQPGRSAKIRRIRIPAASPCCGSRSPVCRSASSPTVRL